MYIVYIYCSFNHCEPVESCALIMCLAFGLLLLKRAHKILISLVRKFLWLNLPSPPRISFLSLLFPLPFATCLRPPEISLSAAHNYDNPFPLSLYVAYDCSSESASPSATDFIELPQKVQLGSVFLRL